jgi:hypothetical protein
MGMMANRVNLDFDFALLKNNSSLINDKYNSEFEYIYFLSDKSGEPLKNCVDYKKDYLDYLKSKGFNIPKLVESKSYSNWWGDLTDFEKVKKLDSKIFCAEIAIENGYCPEEVRIIHNISEFESYITSQSANKFYYRSNFGFSGSGNKIIHKGKNYSLRFPGVVSHYYQVVLALGITVDLNTSDFFLIENFTDENGTFLGGQKIELEIVADKLNLSTREVQKTLESIFINLKEKYGARTVQFDSFLYEDNQGKYWYKLLEVNFRKTMGHVINNLSKKLGPGKWVLRKMPQLTSSYKNLESKLEEEFCSRIVITSPLDRRFLSFYVLS